MYKRQGQAQRIAIARALATNPGIIVLDEPTSSLDVSTQALLLNLLKDLARQDGLSYMLISHDIAAVSYMADRIAVLNGGAMVEFGTAQDVLTRPRNAYTRELIAASPHFRASPTAGSHDVNEFNPSTAQPSPLQAATAQTKEFNP